MSSRLILLSSDRTGQLLSTSTAHTALIRLLLVHTVEARSYLISTGEDKQLVVSSLPDLVEISKRELVKRANDLATTGEGEIVVGDKFGDVYSSVLSAYDSFSFRGS